MKLGDEERAEVVFITGQPSRGGEEALALCHPSDLRLWIDDLMEARPRSRAIDLSWLADDADVQRVITQASWLLAGQGLTVRHTAREVDEASLPVQLERVKQLSRNPDVGAIMATLVSVFEPLPRTIVMAAAKAEEEALEELVANDLLATRRGWVTVASTHLRDELARRMRSEDRTSRHLELFDLLRRDGRTMSLVARLAPGLAQQGAIPMSSQEVARLTLEAARAAFTQRRFLAAASHLRDALASRQLTAAESQEAHILR